MSATELELIYQALLDSGDLKEMFPSMTGNWDKDKTKFSKSYLDSTYLGDDLDDNEENYYDGF